MGNSKLVDARRDKKDEFYTQFYDIEKEISAYIEHDPYVFRNKVILLPCDDPEWSNFTKYFAQNFERFKLKKLISTSFAVESKDLKAEYRPTPFEKNDKKYDKTKTRYNGKIFTLTRDKTGDGRIDVNDLEWSYLKGNGDFRSEEIKKLRKQADFIITNPPYSLWREFFSFIIADNKKFVIISNKNSLTYKELFPYIKANKVWAGNTGWSGGMWFETKYDDDVDEIINGVKMKNTPSLWLTNIDHGKRHKAVQLMTYKENLKFSKHKELKNKSSYEKYVNYNAIEVPYSDSVPKDYSGKMGVPITFLEKYNPDLFEIIGFSLDLAKPMKRIAKPGTYEKGGPRFYIKKKNGKYQYKRMYDRIIIKNRMLK